MGKKTNWVKIISGLAHLVTIGFLAVMMYKEAGIFTTLAVSYVYLHSLGVSIRTEAVARAVIAMTNLVGAIADVNNNDNQGGRGH